MAKKVYISSTFRDLEFFRRELIETITFLKDYFELVCPMEFMLPGSTNPVLDDCLDYVNRSDIYVLIIGKRYGSIAPGTSLSFTEHEYNHAVSKNNMIIIPLIGDDNQEYLNAIPVDNPAEYSRFKNKVQNERSSYTKNFTNPDHLSKQLLLALYKLTDRKWAINDDVKYCCNREAQFLGFISLKEEGKLNVFTIICNEHDQVDYFNHRMAVSEFGLQKEYIKKPLRSSIITSISSTYDKQVRMIIGHMIMNFIPRLQSVPKNIKECLSHYKNNNINNVFVEFKLNKFDTENFSLISTLISFLNELHDECIAFNLTIFFVFTFEFANNETVTEHVVECLLGKTKFEIINLSKLNAIESWHVKEWLKFYITNKEDNFIDNILSAYYENNQSYTMYSLFPKLEEIVKKVSAS